MRTDILLNRPTLADTLIEQLNARCRQMGWPTTTVPIEGGRVELHAVKDWFTALWTEQGIGAVLHLARHCSPSAFGWLGLSAVHADNLLTGIHQIQRYEPLVFSAGETRMLAQGRQVTLIWRNKSTVACPFLELFFLAVWVGLGRSLFVETVNPIAVAFTFAEPQHAHLLDDYFQAALQFRQAQACVVLNKEDIGQALLQSNRRQFAQLSELADQELAHSHMPDWLQRLHECIVQHAAEPDMNSAFLARQLHMSDRQLRRLLNAQGLKLSELILLRRMQLAAELLAARKSITATAYAAGYESLNGFSQAFKRWYGVTPSDYLQQQHHAAQ